MKINRSQVLNMQLSSLGLLQPINKSAAKPDVLNAIRQMGVLQIDTINVVNRSPYLVLWSRLGNYDPLWLEQTQKERNLFEYWAHAACFIPKEDYPLFRRMMFERAKHWWHIDEWVENHTDVIDFVLNSIKEKGPQKSADFPKRSGPNNGWWDWKEEKIALDMLWTRGDLMIAYRKNFQRYYDLREKILDNIFDDQVLSMLSVVENLVECTIEILGATRPKWISDYYRLKKKDVQISLDNLLRQGKVIQVESDDFPEAVLIHKSRLDLYEQALSGKLFPQLTTILSPFDPLIWDRVRTKELFNFDYTLECYLPASKRKFGYFSLPILHNGQLVGRFDAKAHRKKKIFEIKQIHFEPWFESDPLFFAKFSESLLNFAEWHQTSCFRFSQPQVELSSQLNNLVLC